MQRPILLDLFSCEGIGARGYLDAGWTVIGVDLEPRFARRYPGPFVAMDWREALERYAPIAQAIHASPPCQGYSIATLGNPEARERHERLIPAVRDALDATGKPWIIENVDGARPELRDPITLCGTMFGLHATDDDGTVLELRRHRLFESNLSIEAPAPCRHGAISKWVGGVYGGGRCDRREAREVRRGGYTPMKHVREALLGVPAGAHTMHGLSQGLPPVYTEWLGNELLRHGAAA